MKRPSKLHASKLRPTLPPVPQRFKRVRGDDKIKAAFENIPKITNETVAEHREKVLRGARKYKYPLQHSKHRILIVSGAIIIAAVIGFFVYLSLALYRFQSTSAFTYRVTQVVPFQVGRAGDRFVAYENYLFELRRYEHYYQSQQRVDFGSQSGKDQLNSYKPKALNSVIQAAYIKQIAEQHNISLNSSELNDELDSLRAQNHSNNKELEDVVQKFFGWSIKDLKRELTEELLAQKVADTLDKAANQKAQAVLVQAQGGTDFAALAAQNSDDIATKASGGQYANTAITLASTDIPPQVVHRLFTMQVGQVEGVIQAGDTLEVVKLLANDNGKLKAAHISFHVTPIDKIVSEYQKIHPRHVYIKVD